jgi:hypothetical protein
MGRVPATLTGPVRGDWLKAYLDRKGTTTMATQTAAASADLAPATSVNRVRLGLLTGTLAVTSVLGVIGTVLWPAASGDFFVYDDVAPIRGRFFAVLSAMAVLYLLNVPLQGLAGMALVRRRGSAWATTGAALLWLGAAVQATGIAGWAMLYYFTTGPSLTEGAARPFLAALENNALVFAFALAGEVLVVLGTILQAVGLFRAHTVPWWVPVLTLVIVGTFVLPSNGVAGLIGAVPTAAGSIAMAWYAWRRNA